MVNNRSVDPFTCGFLSEDELPLKKASCNVFPMGDLFAVPEKSYRS